MDSNADRVYYSASLNSVRDNLGQKQLAIVIGGGPAGLTCAYELSKHGVASIVLEADHVLGGIARTVDYKGYLFDIGGHRFFTKWDEVQQIWDEILGDKFLRRSDSRGFTTAESCSYIP